MTTEGHHAARRSRGLLIYDGDCAFCTRSVKTLRAWCAPDIDTEPWQLVDLTSYHISEEQANAAVQWVGTDGGRAAGARAFTQVLRRSRRPWPLVGRLLDLPPFTVVAAACYRLIADNRGRLPGGTPACSLPRRERP